MKDKLDRALKDLCIPLGNWVFIDGDWKNAKIIRYEIGVGAGVTWYDSLGSRHYRFYPAREFLEKIERGEVEIGCKSKIRRRELVEYSGNLEVVIEFDEVK